MAEPLGFEHYRDNYTTDELWDMLVTQGNPTSVELSSTVWATARGKLATTREALNTNVSDLVDRWQGPASVEFQDRMSLVVKYSAATEFLMEQARRFIFPPSPGIWHRRRLVRRGRTSSARTCIPRTTSPSLKNGWSRSRASAVLRSPR